MTEKRDSKWIAHVRPDMPLAEAARHVLLARLQVVADYLPRALDEADKDPENVHQLRVGTRRAAAALRIFRQSLPRKAFKGARKRLRRLRRAAGAVRDWDVFLQELKELAPQRPSEEQPGLAFLIGHAFDRRNTAQAELQAVGGRDVHLFDTFLLETVEAVSEHSNRERASTLDELARPLLSNLLRKVNEALTGDLDDYPHLHKVRIAGKRLRYAMEVFIDCFGPSVKEDLYPLVEELQTILGTLHDSYVAAERLRTLRDQVLPSPLVEWARVGPGLEAVLRWHRERLDQEKQSFRSWLVRWRKAGAETVLAGNPSALAAPA